MLLVKTYLKSSPIHGIGLFTSENIKKGQKIWRFQPGFDLTFNAHEVNTMPPLLRDFIKTYAVLSKETGLWVLGCDNVRFTNHSRKANAVASKISSETELISVAGRDIKKDEELTIDYRTIDSGSASGSAGEEYL